jgi:hypothetical protein
MKPSVQVQLPKKKLYQEPTLLRYGSLTEMTTANSNKQSTKDNGSGSMQKTG